MSLVLGRGSRLLVVEDGHQLGHRVAADEEGEVLVLLVPQRVDDLLLLPGTTNHEEEELSLAFSTRTSPPIS